MNSLKGQLLLDSGKLAGSEFHHTVVLICQHDPEGAFGLVLNRMSEQTVDAALSEKVPVAVQDLPLYFGGPVQPKMLSCLIYDPANIGIDQMSILPGLRLMHDLDELLKPSESAAAFKQIKFFAGYAGWSPGQLDNEIQMAAWLTHPASIDLVFHPEPEKLWRLILRGKGPKYRILAEAPDDLENN